jgi:hypothetical protein
MEHCGDLTFLELHATQKYQATERYLVNTFEEKTFYQENVHQRIPCF